MIQHSHNRSHQSLSLSAAAAASRYLSQTRRRPRATVVRRQRLLVGRRRRAIQIERALDLRTFVAKHEAVDNHVGQVVREVAELLLLVARRVIVDGATILADTHAELVLAKLESR